MRCIRAARTMQKCDCEVCRADPKYRATEAPISEAQRLSSAPPQPASEDQGCGVEGCIREEGHDDDCILKPASEEQGAESEPVYKTPPDTEEEFWYMGSFHERLTLEELHKRLLTFQHSVAALERAEWERDPRVIAPQGEER